MRHPGLESTPLFALINKELVVSGRGTVAVAAASGLSKLLGAPGSRNSFS